MLIISECCRALGNLSHYPEVEAIFSNGADQILHQLLDSSDINLVVNVIGIFINFSLVKSDLKVFDQSEGSSDGIFKLLITMREFNDWRVSTLTLQLIWNLLRNAKKVRYHLEQFHFGWLNIKVIDAAFHISTALFFHHLKFNSSYFLSVTDNMILDK